MERQGKNVLTFPLSLLKWSGQHPNTRKSVFVTTSLAMIAMCSQILIVSAYHFYLSFGNPFFFLRNLGSFGGYLQILSKVIIVAFKRNELGALVEDTKCFWDTNSCPTELKNKFQGIFTTTSRLQKVWFYLSTATIIASILQAYFTRQLPVGIWLIEGHNTYYTFHFIMQSFAFFYIITYQVVAIDQIYLGLCMMLITQFTLLNNNLRELSIGDIKTEEENSRFLGNITLCVKYHGFLLRFAKCISRMYSPIMLLQYITLITVLCSAMIIFLESDKIEERIPQAFVMASSFTQMSFYCVVGDYISDQANNISLAIYGMDWYSQHVPEIKYIIPLVIQRSQKETVFSAGGLFEINSRTLLAIFKIAWSICVATRSTK